MAKATHQSKKVTLVLYEISSSEAYRAVYKAQHGVFSGLSLVILSEIQGKRVQCLRCCYRSSAAVLGRNFMQHQGIMKLGVHVRTAVVCGISSKGPWRSSKTPGIQQALSLAFLKAEGLASLRDGWIKLHHSQ
ncbi:hypothetical protein AB833_30840 [Chromatiales bacterium (ex Bugula neritina AB1)]|nr:hypothetical protein AB833_30840 [Chromatiales bacterium (ex Bugula neritina AB1)]